MPVSREELVESFRLLSDEALLRRYRSGDLSETAQMIAVAELQLRGIELAEAPEAPELDMPEETAAESTRGMVTIARLLDPTEAHILLGRLEAEGIPAFIADQQLVQTNRLWTIALGGVRLQVPEVLAQQAQAVITALREGRYALDEDASPEQL